MDRKAATERMELWIKLSSPMSKVGKFPLHLGIGQAEWELDLAAD